MPRLDNNCRYGFNCVGQNKTQMYNHSMWSETEMTLHDNASRYVLWWLTTNKQACCTTHFTTSQNLNVVLHSMKTLRLASFGTIYDGCIANAITTTRLQRHKVT